MKSVLKCYEECFVTISAEEKLDAVDPVQLSRLRRKQLDDEANAIELHKYASVNGSLGFLGQNVSPFCAYFNSYLQQFKGKCKVYNIIKQCTILRAAKKLGSFTKFISPE